MASHVLSDDSGFLGALVLGVTLTESLRSQQCGLGRGVYLPAYLWQAA
jgi:hypothetical protein